MPKNSLNVTKPLLHLVYKAHEYANEPQSHELRDPLGQLYSS